MNESVYCMKCKKKTEFSEKPIYETVKTTRGFKGLLRGSCNLCKGKVSKITKIQEQ